MYIKGMVFLNADIERRDNSIDNDLSLSVKLNLATLMLIVNVKSRNVKTCCLFLFLLNFLLRGWFRVYKNLF